MFKSYKIKKIFYVLSLGNINMCLFIVSTVLSHIVSSLEMNEEINQLILNRFYFLES